MIPGLRHLHKVSVVKWVSRGIYESQEQGLKSDVVTEAGVTDRRSTVKL